MRRGQAAMEFLTTYGFAFIAILTVVGTLNYFGVIDPTSFVPTRCMLDGGIECPSYNLVEVTSGDDYYLDLNIMNNNRDTMLITKAAIREKKGTTYCFSEVDILDPTTNNPIVDDADKTVRRQRSLDLRFTFADNLVTCPMTDAGLENLAGQKKRFEIKLYFIEGSATKATIAEGVLITSVI